MAKINVRDRNKGTGKKPNWEYRFECASIGGRRKSISKAGYRTRREAEAAGSIARAEYEGAGTLIRENEISVADYLALWLEQACKMNSKYRTWEHYNDIIYRYIVPALGKYRLASLSPLIIQEFVNSFAATKLSASYVTSILGLLRTTLDYAVFPLQYIKGNPCEHVRVPRVIKSKPTHTRNIITQDEFNQIMEMYPRESQWHIPLLLGWYNGMRRNEVFGLLWEDIDFEQKTISITRQYELSTKDEVSECYTVRLSKPKYESARTVSVGDNFIEELKFERERQEKLLTENSDVYITLLIDETKLVQVKKEGFGEFGAFGEFGTVVHPICINKQGKILFNKSVEAVCMNISRAIGKHISFHCFRHSNSTYLYEAGAPLKAIQTRLGHKNAKTTYGTYTHTTQVMNETATMLLERSLRSSD